MNNKLNPFEKLLARTKADLAKKVQASTPTSGTVGPVTTVSGGPNGQSIPKQVTPVDVEARSVAEGETTPESKPELEPAPSMPYAEFAEAMQEVKPRNPFLTGNTSVFSDVVDPTQPVDIEEISSVEQLARINTDEIEAEPQDRPVFKNEVSAAAKLTKAMILTEADKVREVCDNFDSQIRNISSLAGPDLAVLRNQVQTIMITLKEHPEFDSVLIADDIKNVFRWIRATRAEALALRDIKVEKKVTREVKKTTTTKKIGTADSFADAFNAIMFNPGGIKS